MKVNVYVTKTVTNCKTASIFKSVDDDPEVDLPYLLTTIKAGKQILVDPSDVHYSWDDKKYYKCKVGRREGYILSALVE